MVNEKLDKLKNSNGVQNDPYLNLNKKNKFKVYLDSKIKSIKQNSQLKLKIITAISLIIALILFSINIFATSIELNAKINPNINSLSQKFLNIITTLKNNQNLESVFFDFESTLIDFQTQIDILNHKLWPIINFDNISDEAWLLSKEWINSLSDLAAFRLSSEGFVSNLNKNFTEYLDVFFEKLPQLIAKTRRFLEKINSYTSWLFWSPNQNINKIKAFLNISFDSLDILNSVYQYRTSILIFLGYKTPHKILIFNQNTGEARPTGGFIGSYLPINITQGRFDIGKSESIYNIDDTLATNLISFPASWYYDLQYGRYDTHGIRNLNYFSCFKDSASLIEGEFNKSTNGQNSDTIIFLTPNLIQNLFTPQTELKIDLSEYNSGDKKNSKKEQVIINKENFYEVIEKITALEYDDPNNPKSAITPILLSIINNLDKVLSKQNQLNIAIDWLRSGFTRDIQIWSKNTELEEFWDIFNFSGDQTCFDDSKYTKCNNWWIKLNEQVCKNYEYAPVLAFLQANISSDKRDIFAQHSFEISVTRNLNENLIELVYKRSYKNLQNLQRKFNSRNGVTFIAFQLPEDAWDYSLDSEQSFNTPFERPFYRLKIKDIKQKELYIPDKIQTVLDSSRDVSAKSFTYNQPDQSLVIGTYINEEIEQSEVKLKFKTKKSNLIFYPTPANSNNLISVDNNSEIIDILAQNSQPAQLIKSYGQAMILKPKN